ncbi:sialic acid-binding Ig-like lectin 15 [Poecilia latipinna]|uniref:sialic acid-binding Ig-like lectin 15 n=1 Tax=Poecilia latipinna TaxID=48699 RepID=UPI00072DA51A|nr:PREDICTED: sialic acid-binding Ig-like lectin 15 [Poecilia latipinna]
MINAAGIAEVSRKGRKHADRLGGSESPDRTGPVQFWVRRCSVLLMDAPWVGRFLVLLLAAAAGFSPAAGGSGDDSWSMQVQAEVRGMDGYPVVLPCTFSHPQHSQHSLLQVMWRLGHGSAAAILYRCTSRPGAAACEPNPQQDQRYRLEGNPREHDLSLRINGATLQDNGRYYCRVEVQGREHVSFEDKMGTRLRVEAPPKILAMSVEGGGPAGFTAVCRVQGSPLPDVQWLGPDDPLEGSSLAPSQALGSPGRYRTISQLRDVQPGQRYTCSASNPLGREQAALFVLRPRPPPPAAGPPPALLLLLAAALGTKLVLLVGVGVWMVQGGALQGVGCWRK